MEEFIKKFEKLDGESINEYWNGTKEKSKLIFNEIHQMYLNVNNNEEKEFLDQHFERMSHGMKYFKREGKMKIAIIGFEVGSVGKWDPSNVKKGITGSEEAIIYCCQELAKQGNNVVVFCDPPEKSPYSLPFSNPLYLNHIQFTTHSGYGIDYSKEHFDMIVLWRKTDFRNYCNRGKVFFWPHDNPRGQFHIEGLSGCFFLSNFQRNTYIKSNPELINVPYIICGNGMQPEQFSDVSLVKSNPYSCIYASCYAWGLQTLINIWPEVKKKFPRATLKIFYGRQTYGFLNENEMKKLVKKINKLKESGVEEIGKVDHITLAEEMKSSSILAYPANVTETFSITMVKAQAAGLIPVTTKMGALKETASPLSSFMSGLDEDNESKFMVKVNQDEYKNILLRTMENIETYDRSSFIEWSKNFTWEKCVNKWMELYKNCDVQ